MVVSFICLNHFPGLRVRIIKTTNATIAAAPINIYRPVLEGRVDCGACCGVGTSIGG